MNKKIKVPKVSKNPNKNWNNNEIQFARFIAEAEAVGAFDSLSINAMLESMDLTFAEFNEIIDRAQNVFEKVNEQI